MKTSLFRIIPVPTEITEIARRAANAGAADHAVLRQIRREAVPAGIVSAGQNLASESFCFRRPRFHLVTRILKADRSLFTPVSASATARLTKIPRRFSQWPGVSRLRFKLQHHRCGSSGWQRTGTRNSRVVRKSRDCIRRCAQRYSRLLYVPGSTRMKRINERTCAWLWLVAWAVANHKRLRYTEERFSEFAARISSMHQRL